MFVLPNDCEVQRYTTRYGNIEKAESHFHDISVPGSIALNFTISWKWDSAFSMVVTGLMCENKQSALPGMPENIMLKYLSPSAVVKIVLITLKSIYCELTHIVLRFVFRFEKVTCGKVPTLHISSWGHSGLLNGSLVHPCKNLSLCMLAICKKRAVFSLMEKCIVSFQNPLFSSNVGICEAKVNKLVLVVFVS